jgi:hypothetical protein
MVFGPKNGMTLVDIVGSDGCFCCFCFAAAFMKAGGYSFSSSLLKNCCLWILALLGSFVCVSIRFISFLIRFVFTLVACADLKFNVL